jgi:hypothetical protein
MRLTRLSQCPGRLDPKTVSFDEIGILLETWANIGPRYAFAFRRTPYTPAGTPVYVRPQNQLGRSGSRNRFSAIALTATMMLDPDMLSAATAGLRVKPAGSSTPAAIGIARAL